MGAVARTHVPGHSKLRRRLRHRLARGLMPDRIPIEPRHPCARGCVSFHHALDHKLSLRLRDAAAALLPTWFWVVIELLGRARRGTAA
jgi:hypothetical protein